MRPGVHPHHHSAEGVMNRISRDPISVDTGVSPWPQRQPGTHLPAEAYTGRHRPGPPADYQQLSRLLAALRNM